MTMDDNTKEGLTQFWELLTVIPCAIKIGTLTVTPCCDKTILWGHTVFKLVTHTCAKITISRFQADKFCGVSCVTIFMIIVPEKFI